MPEAEGAFTYNPNRSLIPALVNELRRVVDHQNRSVPGWQSFSRRLKMSGQNLLGANAIVGKESIGSLGVGPVLAGPRNTFSHVLPKLLHKPSKSFCQPHILKFTGGQFFCKLEPLRSLCHGPSSYQPTLSRKYPL
jgi:hypothetical protein